MTQPVGLGLQALDASGDSIHGLLNEGRVGIGFRLLGGRSEMGDSLKIPSEVSQRVGEACSDLCLVGSGALGHHDEHVVCSVQCPGELLALVVQLSDGDHVVAVPSGQAYVCAPGQSWSDQLGPVIHGSTRTAW
ncbi:hypothetical protein ABZ922_35440 [Streptomyces shenzhenensis]|uniref:hypothetical protein n=1 Tax=Streptomyces shenzhenensis TaxID=943815 RepID=UPI0033F04DD6